MGALVNYNLRTYIKSNKFVMPLAIYTVLLAILCSGGITSMTTIFVFSITNKNVFSLSNIEESSNIKMIGASIRTTGVQGLRFIARVNTDSLCQELDIESTKILKYGIVVSLGETTIDNLYIGSTVNNKKVLYGECDSLFNLENGDFTVVLYNISADLYLQNFSARGYIKYYDGE